MQLFKIIAEIPTYVIITGDAFGMKEYQLTIRAVTVILVGNYLIIVSVPREKGITSSMKAPGIHSVQSMVFLTTYLEIIQSMRASTTTAHVMEVSYDLSSEMRIMFSLLTLRLITILERQGKATQHTSPKAGIIYMYLTTFFPLQPVQSLAESRKRVVFLK